MRMSARWRAPAGTTRPQASFSLVGRAEIELRLQPAGLWAGATRRVEAEVVAWAVLRSVPSATGYRVRVEAPASAPPPRTRFAAQFVPPAPGASTPVVERRGDEFWVVLGSRRAWADDFTAEWDALWKRVDGTRVIATVTVER